MIFGTFGMAVIFLFLGPSPLIGLKDYETLLPTLVSLGALGIFYAAAVAPSYERMVTYGTYARPDADNEMLMTALGSLIGMMTYAGDFIPTVLAGMIYDGYGFSWTMSTAALLCFFAGIMLLVTYLMFGEKEITCGPCGVTGNQKSEEEQALVPLTAATHP